MGDAVDKADEIVSTSELASVLGLTVQRIGQLQREGAFDQHARGEWKLGECVQGYLRFLIGRKPSHDTEGERLRRAQADKIERENRRARGDLLPRELVAETLQGIEGAVVPLLEGMPGIANELSGIHDPAVIRDIIQQRCRAIRDAVADFLEGQAAALEAVQDRGDELAPAAPAQPLEVGGGEPDVSGGERGAGPVSRGAGALVDPAAGGGREPALLASGRGHGDADE